MELLVKQNKWLPKCSLPKCNVSFIGISLDLLSTRDIFGDSSAIQNKITRQGKENLIQRRTSIVQLYFKGSCNQYLQGIID